MSRGPKWTELHNTILRCNEGNYHDHELAAFIEAETGARFTPDTIQRHRGYLGLDPCRRNDWTAPLRRANQTMRSAA